METNINLSNNKSLTQNYIIINKKTILKIIAILLIFFFYFILLILHSLNNKNSEIHYVTKSKELNVSFEYHKYQRNIISKKMRKYASWQLNKNQFYFINGIIRKYKPRNCLEIGVAQGGSSILILNAIKDINNSFLVSIDINTKYYLNPLKKTGHCVKEYFPELSNNWKLFTGEQPHKFLDKLNIKFDFLFLDTVHLAPGELINIIEALPFLNDNSIVVLHDIMFHLPSNRYYNPFYIKYHPSQIYLMTSLVGNKIIIKDLKKGSENIGAVFLYPNQKKYYLSYFLLLLSPWEYLPNDNYINELKIFIEKYYKNELLLLLFNRAVEENKIYIRKFRKFLKKNKK